MLRAWILSLLLVGPVACGDLTHVPTPPVALSALDGNSWDHSGTRRTTSGGRRLLAAVGPDALVTAHVPDLKALVDRVGASTLARIVKSLQATGLAKGTGLSLGNDALPLIGKLRPEDRPGTELVVALESLRWEGTGLEWKGLIAVRLPGQEEELEALLEMIGSNVAAGGQPVEKGTGLRQTFLRIRPKEKGRPPIELAVDSDVFLFGVGEATVTAAMDRMENGGASLTARPEFRQIMKRCGSSRDLMRIHMDPGHLLTPLMEHVPARTATAIRASGLKSIHTLMAAVRIEGGSFVMRWAMASPDRDDLVSRTLGEGAADRSLLDRLPGDVTAFTLFHLDIPQLLSGLRKNLGTTGGRLFDARLKKLKEAGIDLEAVFGEVIGKRGVLANVWNGDDAQSFVELLEGEVLMVELTDEKRGRELLASLPEQAGTLRLKRFEIGSETAVSYALGASDTPGGLALAAVVHDGYLIAGLSEKAIRRVMASRVEGASDHLRELIRKVPEEAAVIGYEDLRRSLPTTFAPLLHGFGRFLGDRTSRPALDLPAQTLTLFRNLEPEVTFVRRYEGGVEGSVRSASAGFGGVGGLKGLVTLWSVAIPNLMRARQTANEASTLQTLDEIHDAQTTFRRRKIRDGDDDGVGEYCFLGELLGERSLRGGGVGSSPDLVRKLKRSKDGTYEAHGYRFRAYLPAEDGSAVGENAPKARLQTADADLSEDVLVVVAWPIAKGRSGERAFILFPTGNVYACRDGSYEGDQAPPADVLSSQADNLACDLLPAGKKGRDGLRWERVR